MAQRLTLSSNIQTIEDIRTKGYRLGEGHFGTAYRIGDLVYKIYDRPYGHHGDAKQCAETWNAVYQKIYKGKYKQLATATHTRLRDRERTAYHVLVTPFIDGAALDSFSSPTYMPIFDRAFKEISYEMNDKDTYGNVLIVGRAPLPVDFDHVRSITSSLIASSTPERTTPLPGKAITEEKASVFEIAPASVISPAKTSCWKRFMLFVNPPESKREKPADDIIGFRSTFMMP